MGREATATGSNASPFNPATGRKARTRTRAGWAELAGGSALVVLGVQRRSAVGACIAMGGGWLLFDGLRRKSAAMPRVLHLAKSVTISRPVDEVYRFWRDLENLPRFLRHVKSVQRESSAGFGKNIWRWRGSTGSGKPLTNNLEWLAEVTDDQENHRLAWQSLEGAAIQTRGWVEFASAPGDRGTEVHVRLEYRPGGVLGRAVALLFHDDPEQQIREDMRRCKSLLEAGEVPTTLGQPAGRRSRLVSLAEPFDRVQQRRAAEPMRARTYLDKQSAG